MMVPLAPLKLPSHAITVPPQYNKG